MDNGRPRTLADAANCTRPVGEMGTIALSTRSIPMDSRSAWTKRRTKPCGRKEPVETVDDIHPDVVAQEHALRAPRQRWGEVPPDALRRVGKPVVLALRGRTAVDEDRLRQGWIESGAMTRLRRASISACDVTWTATSLSGCGSTLTGLLPRVVTLAIQRRVIEQGVV